MHAHTRSSRTGQDSIYEVAAEKKRNRIKRESRCVEVASSPCAAPGAQVVIFHLFLSFAAGEAPLPAHHSRTEPLSVICSSSSVVLLSKSSARCLQLPFASCEVRLLSTIVTAIVNSSTASLYLGLVFAVLRVAVRKGGNVVTSAQWVGASGARPGHES